MSSQLLQLNAFQGEPASSGSPMLHLTASLSTSLKTLFCMHSHLGDHITE